MTPPPEPEKESADSMAVEIGADGIEALPRRVHRYEDAKSRALDVAEYIRAGGSCKGAAARIEVVRLRDVGEAVARCGDWLAFRHYFTVDQVRLHGAVLCRKHLLCPLCAIRRGAKALKAYLDRWEVIRAEKPALRPFLVTLTVRDGESLRERFDHLHRSQRELWMRKHRGQRSSLRGVEGAVWSYEVKRGTGSGQWHPHLHMIALAEAMPDQVQLRAEWQAITGDSFIVDVRLIEQADAAAGFLEVFKYAVKFSDMEPADTVDAFLTLRGKRLIASAGVFRGVVVPEQLTDEPLEELPFVTLFYRYVAGRFRLDDSRGYGAA